MHTKTRVEAQPDCMQRAASVAGQMYNTGASSCRAACLAHLLWGVQASVCHGSNVRGPPWSVTMLVDDCNPHSMLDVVEMSDIQLLAAAKLCRYYALSSGKQGSKGIPFRVWPDTDFWRSSGGRYPPYPTLKPGLNPTRNALERGDTEFRGLFRPLVGSRT